MVMDEIKRKTFCYCFILRVTTTDTFFAHYDFVTGYSDWLRGVDPYGTGGTRPPQYLDRGDMITNVPPPIFLE